MAVEHLSCAIEFANQADDRYGAIDVMNQLAEIHLAQGQIELALARCQEALHLSEDTGNQFWQAESMDLLGRIYHFTQQGDEARKAFAAADLMWREREAARDLVSTLLNWTRLEQNVGRTQRARELCAEAANLADTHDIGGLREQAAALLNELESVQT
jgi:tetratricopeptide (TPR) repeat protein